MVAADHGMEIAGGDDKVYGVNRGGADAHQYLIVGGFGAGIFQLVLAGPIH